MSIRRRIRLTRCLRRRSFHAPPRADGALRRAAARTGRRPCRRSGSSTSMTGPSIASPVYPSARFLQSPTRRPPHTIPKIRKEETASTSYHASIARSSHCRRLFVPSLKDIILFDRRADCTSMNRTYRIHRTYRSYESYKSYFGEELETMSGRIPAATYRLQFNYLFTLKQASAILDYLRGLGVSDCYASPLFMARPGSLHGYDVIDPTKLNPELGTREDFNEFSAQLKKREMGLMIDVVPNHMCIAGSGNQWWNDVLENGPGSRYSSYFDIDWSPPKEILANKTLLPILGDQYGRVLENQEIQ